MEISQLRVRLMFFIHLSFTYFPIYRNQRTILLRKQDNVNKSEKTWKSKRRWSSDGRFAIAWRKVCKCSFLIPSLVADHFESGLNDSLRDTIGESTNPKLRQALKDISSAENQSRYRSHLSFSPSHFAVDWQTVDSASTLYPMVGILA